MYNEYEDFELYEHKRSDKVKWVISFILIIVLLAGVVGAWVMLLKPEDTPPEQEENAPEEVTEDETPPVELYAGEGLTYVFRIGNAQGTANN